MGEGRGRARWNQNLFGGLRVGGSTGQKRSRRVAEIGGNRSWVGGKIIGGRRNLKTQRSSALDKREKQTLRLLQRDL